MPVEAGFVLTTFDPSGSLIQEAIPLNPGADNTFNAETLFGIDFSGDGELDSISLRLMNCKHT